MDQLIKLVPIKDLVLHKNIRHHVEESTLIELAANIKANGILQPLLVRKAGDTLEVICGKRRYLASRKAKVEEVPCYVREIPDEQIETLQLIENVQRDGLHPMDEATIFKKLCDKELPAIVATKLNKSQSFIEKRMKLLDLIPAAQEMFKTGGMELDQALLIARLQDKDQTRTIEQAFRYYGEKKCILPTRDLRDWIEGNVYTDFKSAPFDLNDKELYPEMGACTMCPYRTGEHNLLFDELTDKDRCTNPGCYKNKIKLHVEKSVEKVQEKLEEGDTVLRGANDQWDGRVTIKQNGKAFQVKPVPKGTKNAVPVVITKVNLYDNKEKKKLGKIIYVPGNFEKVRENKSDASPRQDWEEQRRQRQRVNDKCHAFSFHVFKKAIEKIFQQKLQASKDLISDIYDEILDGSNFGMSFYHAEMLCIAMATGLHKEQPPVMATNEWVEKNISSRSQRDNTQLDKKCRDLIHKLPVPSFMLLCSLLENGILNGDIPAKSIVADALKCCKIDPAAMKPKFSGEYNLARKAAEDEKEAEKKKQADKAKKEKKTEKVVEPVEA